MSLKFVNNTIFGYYILPRTVSKLKLLQINDQILLFQQGSLFNTLFGVIP